MRPKRNSLWCLRKLQKLFVNPDTHTHPRSSCYICPEVHLPLFFLSPSPTVCLFVRLCFLSSHSDSVEITGHMTGWHPKWLGQGSMKTVSGSNTNTAVLVSLKHLCLNIFLLKISFISKVHWSYRIVLYFGDKPFIQNSQILFNLMKDEYSFHYWHNSAQSHFD